LVSPGAGVGVRGGKPCGEVGGGVTGAGLGISIFGADEEKLIPGLVGAGEAGAFGCSLLGGALKSPKGSSSKPLPLKFNGETEEGLGTEGVGALGAFSAGAGFSLPAEAKFFLQETQRGCPISMSRHSAQ
jgi:hypothetical protein